MITADGNRKPAGSDPALRQLLRRVDPTRIGATKLQDARDLPLDGLVSLGDRGVHVWD
jgi:hypothetical protein